MRIFAVVLTALIPGLLAAGLDAHHRRPLADEQFIIYLLGWILMRWKKRNLSAT